MSWLHVIYLSYLLYLLTYYAPNHRLRSSKSNLLAVPQTHLKSMGDRAFSSNALILWNSFPLEHGEAQTFGIFKAKTSECLLIFVYYCFMYYLSFVQRFKKLLLKELYTIKYIIITTIIII